MTAWLLRLVLIVVWLGAACTSAAADPAPRTMVRAHLEPSGPVVAGSEVKLIVDLLTTTWFTEAPNWPLFTVPDAVVSLPDEQAENLSEDIDGVHWFGVSRAYRIAPQAGKTFEIAPFAITVYPGGLTTPVQLMTPALKLVATLPPGAQGMSRFFPTTGLTATQKVEPAQAHLRVGDSVTRTITQTAAGTESMMIPPVDLGEVDGLKRYARPPSTRNIVQDRAGLVAGERTDAATYIADHNGRFELPPVTIEWWNTKTQKKETIALPGVSFSASSAREKLLFAIPADAMSNGFPHRIIVIHSRQVTAGCAIALALVAIFWARARIATLLRRTKKRASDARKRYLEGEGFAWRRLCAAARRGTWQQTIPALYLWMDRTHDFGRPARVGNLPRTADASVPELVDAVIGHYDGSDTRGPGRMQLKPALRRAGKMAEAGERGVTLPPLNHY